MSKFRHPISTPVPELQGVASIAAPMTKAADMIAMLRLHALDDCNGIELPTHACNVAADFIADQERRIEALREANGILEDALQEAGDDYPGSNMQEWCQQQIKTARSALENDHVE